MNRRILRPIALLALCAVLLGSVSCGRGGEEADTTVTTTQASVGETTEAVYAVEAAVCQALDGQLWLMEGDGTLYAVPYDRITGEIRDADGRVLFSVFDCETGDRLRLTHGGKTVGASPAGYTSLSAIELALDASHEPGVLHGIVRRVGETLLLYPALGGVLDMAGIDPAKCYEIPLEGVPICGGISLGGALLTAEELAMGDYVEIRYRGSTAGDAPSRIEQPLCVIKCGNVTRQMTVSGIMRDQLVLGDVLLGRESFANGHVFDMHGNRVAFEDIREGDVLEVRYDGALLTSAPGRFAHFHSATVLTLPRTEASQIPEEYNTQRPQPRAE